MKMYYYDGPCIMTDRTIEEIQEEIEMLEKLCRETTEVKFEELD